MRIKYFPDTDTALLEFSDDPVRETQAFGENLYVDFGDAGNVVAITIEHAGKNANMKEIAYIEMPSGAA